VDAFLGGSQVLSDCLDKHNHFLKFGLSSVDVLPTISSISTDWSSDRSTAGRLVYSIWILEL